MLTSAELQEQIQLLRCKLAASEQMVQQAESRTKLQQERIQYDVDAANANAR